MLPTTSLRLEFAIYNIKNKHLWRKTHCNRAVTRIKITKQKNSTNYLPTICALLKPRETIAPGSDFFIFFP